MAKKSVVETIKEAITPKKEVVVSASRCNNCDGEKYCYQCSDPKVVDKIKA